VIELKKIFMIAFSVFLLIPFNSVKALELAKNASSVIVMEPTTGEIIYERASHERRHPASMTKIMTMLIVMESIEDGLISWEDMVTVSENASSMGGSQILLETGEQMSVYDLFKGLSVASGNDAAVALAEKIAGSEEEFVNMMNERAKDLGLADTNFKNCHGLDDANHYSSAYDMAIMARELVKHEKIFEFTSIYEDYLRKGTDRSFWLVNTNKLVRFYKGVDGLKTGYTSEAGFCITATAKINDMRIITVVMGEPDTKTRNSDVASVFDYVYAQYALNKVVKQGDVIDTVNVNKGKLDKVDIISSLDVSKLYKKSDGVSDITYEAEIYEINAPVKKGDVVGKLKLSNGTTIDLTVKEDVKKANIIEYFYKYLKQVIN
jgi:D-alanyl-D-alanine carboxypeptidase (penicillin-binding protein 5/6)